MAKNKGDVILRDRMQFQLDGSGDRSTLYGRIDLSAYVNPVSREGLAVKEIRFHLRAPNGSLTNSGVLEPVGDWLSSSGSVGVQAAIKLFATTRAYENAKEVGIASPDVLCVLEKYSITGATPAGTTPALVVWEEWYGPADLHPEGYTVVSDLLIGVATDNWVIQGDEVLEIDVMIIAEPITVTTDRMNEILSQGMDL